MHSWKALKRLCRFFNGLPRLVYVYRQQTVDHVDVYTDTDWAGCPKTRKSTSGGCVLMGHHAIKHWSSTQASVTLSSGEAEFNGVIRGAGQGLGYQALLKDLGVEIPLRVWTDSSAAIGICTRQGLGKLRHLDTHTLWIQQAVRNKRIDLKKVLGEQNPADILTKHSFSREKLMDLVKLYDCEYRDGRAETAPMLRKGASNKMTMADGVDELGLTFGETQTTSGGFARNTFGETHTSPKNTSGETWTRSATVSSVNAALAQEEDEEHPTAKPRMPHTELSTAQLDAAFPSIQAPEDDGLDDLARDEADVTLAAGLRIAEDIAHDMAQHGRTRREGGPARGRPETTPAAAEPACALSCCATRRLALGDFDSSLALLLPRTTTLVHSGASLMTMSPRALRSGCGQ